MPASSAAPAGASRWKSMRPWPESSLPSLGGSMTIRAEPAPTCTLRITISSRTVPGMSARTSISVFITSSTQRGSPTATVSPGSTETFTTTDGAGARTTPA